MEKLISFKELSLELDARERPIEAAWAYEVAIQSTDAEVDFFLNLALLYFQCVDYGYQVHHQLREDFVAGCWTRSFEVLDSAERLFGDQTEIQFWRAYFSSIYIEKEGIEDLCRKVVHRGDSLLPAAYLFVAGEVQYLAEAQQLLASVKEGRTERERYVKSVVEAALMRHDTELRTRGLGTSKA